MATRPFCLASILALALLFIPNWAVAQDKGAPATIAAPASTNQSDALLRLGDYYSDGVAIAPDYPKALEYYRQAADAGRSGGALRVGEMMIAGQGTPSDVQGGLAILETLAAEDYPAALVVLGKLYVAGIPGQLTADPDKGLTVLRRAALGGDPSVMMSLGDLLVQVGGADADPSEVLSAYQSAADAGLDDALLRIGDFWTEGKLVPVDLAKGYEAYKRSSQAGSGTGTLRMAEMLARGQGTAVDAPHGLEILRGEAAAGNSSAMMLLARLLVSGDVGAVDGQQAIEYLENAVAAGRKDALLRLAEMYRDGVGIPASEDTALEYLEKAAAVGIQHANYLLAAGMTEGRFGPALSAEEGMARLEQALADGLQEAAVGLSNAHLYGFGVKQDPKAAIALLETQADAGNFVAAQRLLELYRDGSRDGNLVLVVPDADKAKTYFDRISPRLDRSERLIQSALLRAAFVRGGNYDFVAEHVHELPPDDQGALLRSLVRVAPNAYVYLVQKQLQAIGQYQGALNAQLDKATISAMYRFCDLKQAGALCRRAPLSSQAAQILSYAY